MTETNPPNLAELERLLPAGALITDPDVLANYRWDRAYDPDAVLPAAVAVVTNTDQVQQVVRFAAQSHTPIVPRGAGSGLSGGSSSIVGAIVLSLEKMQEITIDPVTRIAKAQAGALNIEVKRAAAEHGLWYPPDPASVEFSSIGGNVATNAGGLCCVKYGVTTDYVLGMTVVLADATVVTLGGPRLKDVAGLSLTKLFVGSEGTLGVITDVTLKLLPAQRPPTTLIATFATLEEATQTILKITQTIRPSMLEFMDSIAINAVEDLTHMGLDRTAAAMLVIQSDETQAEATREMSLIETLCQNSRAKSVYATNDPHESESFVAARRMAIPAVEKKGSLFLGDVGVPLPLLGKLVTGIHDIAQKHQVLISVIAHAGDGNTHPLLVFDPEDEAQKLRAGEAYGEIMDLAINLGGTITGEHGVGRLKKAWLPAYLGPEVMALNRRVKQALDPQNIMNPGAVF